MPLAVGRGALDQFLSATYQGLPSCTRTASSARSVDSYKVRASVSMHASASFSERHPSQKQREGTLPALTGVQSTSSAYTIFCCGTRVYKGLTVVSGDSRCGRSSEYKTGCSFRDTLAERSCGFFRGEPLRLPPAVPPAPLLFSAQVHHHLTTLLRDHT